MDKQILGEIRDLFHFIDKRLVAIFMNSPQNNVSYPASDWMTAAQLAEYWQLLDEGKKPRTAGILKWTKRPADQFLLSHAYMGDLLRFHREDVDKWAKEAAERRRLQKESKRLKFR